MIPSLTKITRGISGARWHLASYDETVLQKLGGETNEEEIILRCLLNRGFTHANEVKKFLTPEFSADLHSPLLLRDMRQAVDRIHQAISDRQRILIVTDFDVDGTTSSVILSQTLKLLGGGDLITCYIPNRFTEGYGLSKQIVEKAVKESYRLIITADIGIKSHAEARLARENGIDLIICDHHLPDGEDVPTDAFAVLCPKGSSGADYPNKHLAACGVALKFAQALLNEHPKRDAIIASLAKLTAIGTVADMVDLAASENRAIVAFGLKGLSQPSNNPGLRALLAMSNVGNPVTPYDVSFKLGPRINAAGRVAHANSVLKLFEAKTDEEAMKLAFQLDDFNAKRQGIQSVLVEKLKRIVEAEKEQLDRVLIFAGTEEEGFHRGVLGIACSKIVELTGRPTLICAINEDGLAHGSGRSINGFHLVEALDSVSDALVKYGGHPMAAGFTVESGKIEEIRWRLNRHAAEVLSEEELGRTLFADCEIGLQDATVDLTRSLARLEPHGVGNPQPLFLMRHLPLRAVQVLKEKHLKLLIGTNRTEIEALWWNAAEHQPGLITAREISLMCRLEINSWNNRENCQLKIIDVAVE